ncbi:FGGY family carbohydrate kinase [Pedobacter sp. ASV1-7]|uniref:FGGY-family carbohydrate kinase n=1 Tax=Pedobacter sp. ASV1-7 TaxID=3145237 RepID=UPI0032E8DD7C
MTNQDAYIVIDIGTGNVRVAVATTSGEILGLAREDLQNQKDYNYPDALFFNPDDLWDQIIRLTRKVLAEIPEIRILALTATSQREGVVLIGKSGESLIGLPNIDHRGREWEDMIADKSEVYQLTGRYPTSLFSALKIVGIKNRLPVLWNEFATFLSISDWVEYKLSGVLHYEHSQASETMLYNVEKHDWSDRLCAVFEIERSILPKLILSGTVIGQIIASEAAAFNIDVDAQVIVGGADTQLAVISTQPLENDVVIVSGTTTPIIKITSEYVTDDQERTWTNRHTDEHSFILEANAGVTGLNYQRLKEIFYPKEGYDVIEDELQEITHFQCLASLGSLLADEKTPLTRGGFIFDAPVSHLLTRGSFVWATLWDIACSIRENYKSLCEVTTHDQDYIWVCGGGVQSRTLRQFIANLIQKRVIIRKSYRQSSVIGGVYICNKALGKAFIEPLVQEEVFPENNEQHQGLYNEWKKTRASFTEIFS